MSYKRSSSLLNIGAAVTETDVDTFTELQVNLPLNTLDREIFVVTDILIYTSNPDMNVGGNSALSAYCSKVSLANRGLNSTDPSDSYFLGAKQWYVYDGGAGSTIATEALPSDQYTTGTERDHLAVVATPDFFISIRGSAQSNPKEVAVRLTGYRAIADADTYAALVTEELNN